MKKLFAALTCTLVLFTACNTSTGTKKSSTPHPPTPSTSLPEQDLPLVSGEEEEEAAVPETVRYIEDGPFELPIHGATGWASIALDLKTAPDAEAEAVDTLPSGASFQISHEDGDWWYVHTESGDGWLPHTFCFIDLVDVVPSIIYDNTNTYSSLYISSGREIPGITGATLYDGYGYNGRLGYDTYIMPVLYATAKKVCAAQQLALAEGNTLKIHEAYRPYSTQLAVIENLSSFAQEDETVMAGIDSAPWGMNWFIATGVSNHQVGYAIDVTLARVDATQDTLCGTYSYTRVMEYTEYEMHTPIHELSLHSAVYSAPVPARTDAWKTATLNDAVTEPSMLLQSYCTEAGLTPLASEWWHFNDLDALAAVEETPGTGDFIASSRASAIPSE